jgi:hypothetical protein
MKANLTSFALIVSVLSISGIPFDILRLDQVLMDPNQFTDFDGRPRYGAIIWDAPDPISSSDEELLAAAVEKLHTSLIVVGDCLQPPVIQRLLGIRYKGSWMHSAHPMVTGQSFIVRGLPDDLRTDGPRVVAAAPAEQNHNIKHHFEGSILSLASAR